jgi:hypothetical protein
MRLRCYEPGAAFQLAFRGVLDEYRVLQGLRQAAYHDIRIRRNDWMACRCLTSKSHGRGKTIYVAPRRKISSAAQANSVVTPIPEKWVCG